MTSLRREKFIYKGLQVPLFTKKGFSNLIRKDKSTAVFPIVLENEEPVYLCFCSSFDDSIVDYGRRLLGSPDQPGKGNILERKHSNTTRTIISNRFTKKTNARKKHIG